MTEQQKYDWILTWVNSCITESQFKTCKKTAREVLNDYYYTEIVLAIETRETLPSIQFNPLNHEQTK